MDVGIMGAAVTTTVDVRDMLCAQALAVVSQAMARLATSQALELLYNAEDVRRDILAWADEQGHGVSEPSPQVLRLQKATR